MRRNQVLSCLKVIVMMSMAVAGLAVTPACVPTVLPPAPDGDSTEFLKTASEWVASVNWEEAQKLTITAHEHQEAPGDAHEHDEDAEADGHEHDEDAEADGHDDMPEMGDTDDSRGVVGDYMYHPDNDLAFDVGKPYILTLTNFDANDHTHYFHAPNFYKAIATRKAQTSDAEYKAPYFDDFELLPGGSLDLYFVPVIAGRYEMWCTNSGHRDAGLLVLITITGGEGLELDLEVAPDFDTGLPVDERRSSSHPVWEEDVLLSQTVTITDFAFSPSEFTLAKDVGHKLTLTAPATNESKHYHTAAELYKTVVTRKAQDSQAEIRVPYFKAIELLVGGTTDLYIVPTLAGSYELICTVPGHADLGMTGTITVGG